MVQQILIFIALLCLVACSDSRVDTQPVSAVAETEAPIGAYMIVVGQNFDHEDFRPYAIKAKPLVEKYGGEFIAHSTNVDVLEGTFDPKLAIISKWKSKEALYKFWNSPEFQEVKKLRDGVGEFDILIVRAIPYHT